MAIDLINTCPDIGSVWCLETYKSAWIIRTSEGIYSINKSNQHVSWFIPTYNERFFSYKPFLIINDILVFSSHKEGDEHALLFGVDVINGKTRWFKELNWAQLSHLAGILSLKNEIILLDWLADRNKSVELQRVDIGSGNKISSIPAIPINPTAIDIFGQKSSAATSNNIYLCQRNNAIFQFGLETSFRKLNEILTGLVQEIATTTKFLFVYLWEDGNRILLRFEEDSGNIKKSNLPLQNGEEVASIIALDTSDDQSLLVVLIEDRNGIALIDFVATSWKWRLNNEQARFDSAIWTPYGIACVVNEKQTTGYVSELRLLDDQTGETIDSVRSSSLDNWIGWHDDMLLASSSSGLLFYVLR